MGIEEGIWASQEAREARAPPRKQGSLQSHCGLREERIFFWFKCSLTSVHLSAGSIVFSLEASLRGGVRWEVLRHCYHILRKG